MRFPRRDYSNALAECLRRSPAVAILGPRQCGKSTLARMFLDAQRGPSTFLDLERPSDLARLSAAPEEDLGRLQRRQRYICIDEIQRIPSIFALLRPLLDDPERQARYLLLGSASPHVVRGVSESLAGRVSFVDLTPLLTCEIDAAESMRQRLWVRGGLPPSFLSRSTEASWRWREDYVRTFLERDVPTLGFRVAAVTLHRFYTMLAHLHGGLFNASQLAAGLGVSPPAVDRYLDLLEGTFMIRRLPPYWANIGKRLVKAPKVYVRDSGVLHSLLGIHDWNGLRSHPKLGASWEGWVIEQIVGTLRAAGETVQAYFWRTHAGAEVDLLLDVRGRLLPIEIKLGHEPHLTRALLQCCADLALPRGFVFHSGPTSFPLSASVEALSATLLHRPEQLVATLLGRSLGPAIDGCVASYRRNSSGSAIPKPTAITARRTTVRPRRRANPAPPKPPARAPATMIAAVPHATGPQRAK